MWNPNIKEIHITKLVHMIFSSWFGYFEYVGYLLCGIMLVVLNVLIWSLSVSIDLPDHGAARNLQHATSQTTFDTFDQSQHLLHTLHKSFFAFSCIFTFLEIIKRNMPKMLLFSSTFNIKMATQKFNDFDKFF